jgi:hypothetical protein
VKTEWFKGLKTDEEREKVVSRLKNHRSTLRQLKQIIGDLRKVEKVADYENPNWPYYEANRQGYNMALDRVLSLLED